MFTGIQSYGSTYRREMGETPADVVKAQKWQEAHRPKAETRPREMGETPEEAGRANAQNTGRKASEMTEQERRIDLFA